MHLPLLPFEFMSVHLETNTFRLNYVEWLDVVSWFVFGIFSK